MKYNFITLNEGGKEVSTLTEDMFFYPPSNDEGEIRSISIDGDIYKELDGNTYLQLELVVCGMRKANKLYLQYPLYGIEWQSIFTKVINMDETDKEKISYFKGICYFLGYKKVDGEIKIIGVNRGEVMHFSDSEISSEPRRLRTAIKENICSLLTKIMKNRLM